MLNRRKFLKVTGGGIILAAGGAGGFLATRTPHQALEPWKKAGTYGDPREKALSYALLAPNPHNRQPWEVDLSKENQITIYRDPTRNLPETDPFDRQLTIGMGCFIELMVMAARQDGYDVKLELFPKGASGPIAICNFKKGAEPDPLFANVLKRRSCKEPFENRGIPAHAVTALKPFASIITDEIDVKTLKDITWKAWKIEAYLPRTLKESVDLFRIGKSEINANPDGINLGGPFFETLAMLGILTREQQLNTNSSGFKQGIEIYRSMLYATPAYGVVTSKNNTRFDQIEAGRRWVRLNLKTTSLGLSLHPVSQCLQEFSEMKKPYQQAHDLLAKNGETVQMLGRLGYGPKTAPSPRWPLETRIINA